MTQAAIDTWKTHIPYVRHSFFYHVLKLLEINSRLHLQHPLGAITETSTGRTSICASLNKTEELH